MVFKLKEGLRLTVEFDDPDGLIGKDGCSSGGYMNLVSSQGVLENRSRELSVSQPQYDTGNNLVGFITAAPIGVAFDYEIRFYNDAGRCMLEDISSRFEWMSNDQTLRPVIKPRPNPNIIFKTPAGDPLVYDYGFFYSEDPFAPSLYFTPSSKPSLRSGETYFVNVHGPEDFSVNETMVVAQAGDFDVVLESEPLVRYCPGSTQR